MKTKYTITVLILIICCTTFLLSRKPKELHEKAVDYKQVDNLVGIGCIRIGESVAQVTAAIDSMYSQHKSMLNHEYIKKQDMINYVGPKTFDIPDKYNEYYRRYHATVVISETLIAEEVELFFWRDTLHMIKLSNSNPQTREVAQGMIWKYGNGEGYCEKSATKAKELHKWGNETCVATYKGETTYILNNDGLACGIDRWYHNIEIKLNDLNVDKRIDNYLHEADSLWHEGSYANL